MAAARTAAWDHVPAPLREVLGRALADAAQGVVDRHVEAATEELRHVLRERLAAVALEISHRVSVETRGQEIVVRIDARGLADATPSSPRGHTPS